MGTNSHTLSRGGVWPSTLLRGWGTSVVDRTPAHLSRGWREREVGISAGLRPELCRYRWGGRERGRAHRRERTEHAPRGYAPKQACPRSCSNGREWLSSVCYCTNSCLLSYHSREQMEVKLTTNTTTMSSQQYTIREHYYH